MGMGEDPRGPSLNYKVKGGVRGLGEQQRDRLRASNLELEDLVGELAPGSLAQPASRPSPLGSSRLLSRIR